MEDDDGETETDQQQAATEQTSDSTQAGTEQDSTSTQAPFFVAATEDEYKAKIGSEQTQARVGLAKKYGYDTLEAFDAAMKSYKELADSKKTEQERLQEQNQTLTTQNQTLTERLNGLALQGEIARQAEAVGLNPERLEAINELRPKNAGEIDEQGNVNADLVKASLESVLNKFPEFKAPAETVGVTATAASAAAQTTTIDEQIAEAQKKGDFGAMIELQMMKLQAPS